MCIRLIGILVWGLGSVGSAWALSGSVIDYCFTTANPKQCLVETNQLHFNGVQTSADELDVFNTDVCIIQGNYVGDTDFTPMAQYGIQLFNCTGILIANNTFGPTIHGPLLAPFNAATGPVATTIAANVAVGIQEVTPASMANIVIGAILLVQNSDDSNQESVAVTAVTGGTFTAIFATTKTGPGIKVKANETSGLVTRDSTAEPWARSLRFRKVSMVDRPISPCGAEGAAWIWLTHCWANFTTAWGQR